MEPSFPKKRWRPRLRFTLRALMIVMTLICLWLGYQVSAARTQQRVVKQLREADVYVEYRDETLASTGQPPSALRQWVGKWFGIDHVDVVFAVHVESRCDPDHIMPLIAQLPDLNTLGIQGLTLSDKNLQGLRRLRNLQSLNLRLCSTGEKGLHHLAHCSSLRKLYLSDWDVTVAGLQALASLPYLESLSIDVLVLDDQRLSAIAQIRGLRELVLPGCQVTDHGMRHIAHLPELRKLCITSSNTHDQCIGDDGLRELAVLKHLEDLSVGIAPHGWGWQPPARISAAGLRQLAHLPLKHLTVRSATLSDGDLEWLTEIPNLETLTFYRTQVSKAGEAALLKKLPWLKKLEIRDGNFGRPGFDPKELDPVG